MLQHRLFNLSKTMSITPQRRILKACLKRVLLLWETDLKACQCLKNEYYTLEGWIVEHVGVWKILHFRGVHRRACRYLKNEYYTLEGCIVEHVGVWKILHFRGVHRWACRCLKNEYYTLEGCIVEHVTWKCALPVRHIWKHIIYCP